jgi:cytochrome c oxidase subunit 3
LASVTHAAPPHDDAPPELRHHFPDLGKQREASSLGMWIFLVTEVLFFGGMFTAYAIYRETHRRAFEGASNLLDLRLGTINTIVLIVSSLTMALAVWASGRARKNATVLFLVLTMLLGATFLGIKYVEYKQKFDRHEVPGPHFVVPLDEETHKPLPRQSEMFFSLYFCMTGLHAVHMIIGLGLVSWLVRRARRGEFSERYNTPVDMVGLYWHFVDIIWIYLFPLLYLLGRHTL